MANTVQVEVVSAEGELYSGVGEMVYAPGIMGELGIAPRHAPLVTRLKAGDLRIDAGEGKQIEHFYVSGGILEVQPFKITVMADTGLRGEDLDEEKALEAKRRAEDAILNKLSEIDVARAEAELAQAAVQLSMISKLRNIKRL